MEILRWFYSYFLACLLGGGCCCIVFQSIFLPSSHPVYYQEAVLFGNWFFKLLFSRGFYSLAVFCRFSERKICLHQISASERNLRLFFSGWTRTYRLPHCKVHCIMQPSTSGAPHSHHCPNSDPRPLLVSAPYATKTVNDIV